MKVAAEAEVRIFPSVYSEHLPASFDSKFNTSPVLRLRTEDGISSFSATFLLIMEGKVDELIKLYWMKHLIPSLIHPRRVHMVKSAGTVLFEWQNCFISTRAHLIYVSECLYRNVNIEAADKKGKEQKTMKVRQKDVRELIILGWKVEEKRRDKHRKCWAWAKSLHKR